MQRVIIRDVGTVSSHLLEHLPLEQLKSVVRHIPPSGAKDRRGQLTMNSFRGSERGKNAARCTGQVEESHCASDRHVVSKDERSAVAGDQRIAETRALDAFPGPAGGI